MRLGVSAASFTGGDNPMNKTVLTVDDSRTMRDMLMLALSNAGYRIVQAEDGIHDIAGAKGKDRRRCIEVERMKVARRAAFARRRAMATDSFTSAVL
jgi:CheY-like chemotaxis protein